jgi:hypothetical protein
MSDKVPTPAGYTEPVDKYYEELAHWILDKAGRVDVEDAAMPSLEDLERSYEDLKARYESEKTPENEKNMLIAGIAFLKAKNRELSTDFKTTVEKSSAFFPNIPVKAGLKTRRRKHRNGPSRVRRHRSQRVSGRKDKT